MRFPMIVYKSENSAYCGLLPDFPGCYPMGETIDALMTDAQDAVETWMEGEDPAIFPIPTSLEMVRSALSGQGWEIRWASSENHVFCRVRGLPARIFQDDAGEPPAFPGVFGGCR